MIIEGSFRWYGLKHLLGIIKISHLILCRKSSWILLIQKSSYRKKIWGWRNNVLTSWPGELCKLQRALQDLCQSLLKQMGTILFWQGTAIFWSRNNQITLKQWRGNRNARESSLCKHLFNKHLLILSHVPAIMPSNGNTMTNMTCSMLWMISLSHTQIE